MTVAMEAPSKQKNARTTLPAAENAQQRDAPQPRMPSLPSCVCLCSQQYSLQLGSPSSNCMRAALPIRGRRCHQIAQQLGFLHRPIFQKSQRPTVSRPCHTASFSPFFELLLPLLVSTHFRCKRSACGHRTLTSMQSCRRTPGNQETTSNVAHLTLGAASSSLLTQS